jgi:hypothetical protein
MVILIFFFTWLLLVLLGRYAFVVRSTIEVALE